MREIVHIQAGQCGNQIGSKVRIFKAILIEQILRIFKILVLGSDFGRAWNQSHWKL